MKKSIIRGTGKAVPSRVVTNNDLTEFIDTTDEWIKQRTGIEQRYWVPEDEEIGTSDLGLEASLIALDRAGWVPEDIDFIIFATLSPDIFFPGSGCLLQTKLGLKNTPALDIRQQCTGFLYGLATADSYIKSGLANKILLVGAEIQSTGLDKSTRGRDMTVIFGDGGAALCIEGVETDENVGVIASCLHADGKGAEVLSCELPASKAKVRIPLGLDEDSTGQFPKMDGKVVFKSALRRLPKVTKDTLDKANMKLEDVDLIIPHQANLRINQAYCEILKLDPSKMFNNIQKYGNTTAATIPLALDEAMEKGLIGKPGDVVMFTGLGAGITWGGVLYKFP
jgi:3-oxoacyl-[acyl-carrier-protein] synthase III